MPAFLTSISTINRRFFLFLGILLFLTAVGFLTSGTGAHERIETAPTPVPASSEFTVIKDDPVQAEDKRRIAVAREGEIIMNDAPKGPVPEVANAIRNLAGCNASVLAANDDGSAGPIALPFSINYFGVTYSQTFVNNNGNITFGTPLGTFTPFNLNTTNVPIMAPFFADVDTRGTGSGLTRWGSDTLDGCPVFCVNWVNVGYFSAAVNRLNSFQLLLIQRSDTGTGNFDIEFNYNTITWETGNASGGSGGLGGNSARAGYANGTVAPGTSFELPGSAVNGGLLDSNFSTGLTNNSNSGTLGRYIFTARNGGVPSPTPTPTPVVTIAATRSSVQENGATSLAYTFTRTGGTNSQLSVFYSIGGTATPGADFVGGVTTSNIVFQLGESTYTETISPIPDLLMEPDETVILTLLPRPGYEVGTPSSATGTIVNVPAPFCSALPISIGQTYNGILGADSCLLNGNRTDFYTFNGTVGQRVALTMTTQSFFSRLELVDPAGNVIETAGTAGVRDSRLPTTDYRTLTAAGQYTIRAIGSGAAAGAYALSLFVAPTTTCTFSLSPERTNIPSGGGTFFFDVLTQPGCAPPAAPVAPAGLFYNIVSYVNGRVTFSVDADTGAAREATILVGNRVHQISQFGTAPPGNDLFANAQLLTGFATPPASPIIGSNTNATAEPGEPAHAGSTATKSVWYSFTPPAGAAELYSFSTSGSGFDTVLAVYACPLNGGCTFANMILVGSNDDTSSFDTTSKVNFRIDAGTRYVIAVDGKNGASGTIQLTFMPYRRLFRLYLHNYNGSPVTIVPDSVVAISGSTSIPATRISLGVYEFDLPADNSTYTVRISGPTGIVWDPNNFPLDTSFRLLDELMRGAGGSGQNSTSNAQCLDGCDVIGFVKNITPEDITQGRLRVKLGYSRDATPARRDEEDCALSFQSDLGVPHARYQCIARPQTTHEIVPSMAGKRFVDSIFSFTNPVGAILENIRTPRFTAADAPTFSISGRVLAGGEGTIVDLSYTPAGAPPIVVRTRTGANGTYQFQNLVPGVYQPVAIREGFIFNTPAPVNLQTANAAGVDITAQAACAYGVANPAEFGASGGAGNFAISTAATCDWEAASEVDWVRVNSGVGRGNGNVLLTILPNVGPARTGAVRLRNRTEPIVINQANGCGFSLSPPAQVNFTAAGGTGSVNVTATAAECGFTPTATDYCMVTTLTAGGVGNAVVNFAVSPNRGVARSTTITVGATSITLNQAAAAGTHRTRFDFDGDGRADLSVFRPSTGTWFVQRLGLTGFENLPFGLPTDVPVAADYDGDGRTDFAVFRPSNTFWYSINSSNGSFLPTEFGASTDIPVPADYDGDGRDNIAVFRPSNGTWYTSTDPAINYGAVQFGAAGDIPRPADYDGDGRADIAVYRPSNGVWYGIGSSTGQQFSLQFGATGDMPVPGDYNGDGSAELAVYRPANGVWYRMNVGTGQQAATQWGGPGDVPVPADYNGDKSTDLAVYRPSDRIWYIWSCTSNPLFSAQQFGFGSDVIIPSTNRP